MSASVANQGGIGAEELYQLLADEVTSVTSHELKAPLRSIASLCEWIAEDLGSDIPDSVSRNLDRLMARVERLDRVTDSLRAFASAGKPTPERSPIRPIELIGDAVAHAAPPESFDVDVQARATWFHGARGPLLGALTELVRNAVKHHDGVRGRITIAVREQDDACIFTVSDDGPGVPQHGAGRIFGLFQSLGDDRDGGVGLAMARRVTEAHGGRLELVPTDRLRGATFRLTWPRMSAPSHSG
jgi:signal transduction histidine kinase